MATTTVRLPNNIEDKLNKLCTTTKRTKSFYIKEALAKHLDDIGDTYISLDRIVDPKHKLVAAQDILKKLNK